MAAAAVVVVVRSGKLAFGTHAFRTFYSQHQGQALRAECVYWACRPKAAWGQHAFDRCVWKLGGKKRPTAIIVVTDRQTHRKASWAIGNGPLCTRICPYTFFEVTPPGTAPGPPVKTGARVRRFRGCNTDSSSPLTTGQ